jgi:hypothetical protein
MGVALEVDVNNAQCYSLQCLDSKVEWRFCKAISLAVPIDDVSPLDDERVVVWEFSRDRPGFKARHGHGRIKRDMLKACIPFRCLQDVVDEDFFSSSLISS